MNDFTQSLFVDYCSSQPIAMGRLVSMNRRIAFEYTPEFLKLGFELSPFKLPLKPGVQFSTDRVFDGLFGVFNDSLPDGWGRLLLDRKLKNKGVFPSHLTPLDRLRYVGTHGMGALQYRPEFPFTSMEKKEIELDQLAQECTQFEEKEEEPFLDELIQLNGSSAGARPKILVSLDSKTKLIRASDNHRNHTHPDWIVKFRSSVDPLDMGSIEYAYHLMATIAGVIVPEARLFKSKLCSGYFGVKRFDRNEKIFLHSHTLSGLLHANHRIPSLDYEAVMKATAILTKNIAEQKKQFRHIAFNVFAHNRDDHAKNFSFLMDENGILSVSPAYDLTFSAGPGGEHCTTVMGNGRSPGKADLLKLAAVSGIDTKDALDILSQVKEAVSQWKQWAQEAGVSKSSMQLIQKSLCEQLCT